MRRCGSCIAPRPIIASIVLAKTNLPTLNHVAFEMPAFDLVMRGMGRMKDNGYPVHGAPAATGPGDNVFADFCGPDEVPLEYAAEVLQVDDSYRPRPVRAIGNSRPAGPINGASPSRARRAITACSGCSVTPPTATGLL